MSDVADSPEMPDVFLARLGDALIKKEGVDIGLTDILTRHILTATPAKDAVAQAKAAIIKLASERAASPKTEIADV